MKQLSMLVLGVCLCAFCPIMAQGCPAQGCSCTKNAHCGCLAGGHCSCSTNASCAQQPTAPQPACCEGCGSGKACNCEVK